MPRKRKLTDDENADINNDIDVNNDVDDDSDVQNEVTKNKRKKCQTPECTSLAARGGGLTFSPLIFCHFIQHI